MTTEKGKVIARWAPSDQYMSEYDRIFKKDKCLKCGGETRPIHLLSDPPIPINQCKKCGYEQRANKEEKGELGKVFLTEEPEIKQEEIPEEIKKYIYEG